MASWFCIFPRLRYNTVNTVPAASGPLSLHHLTALELSPVELVDLAAALGCSHVGLFTCLPPGMATRFPCIHTDEQEAAVAERLAATGVRVNNAEVFALREGLTLTDYRTGLERAARLGAQVATVHLHESSPGLARALLTDFCDLTASAGLRVALEFTSFSAVRSLYAALQMLEAIQHPAACLAIDALHFFRNGGDPGDLDAIPHEWVGYLQLCDGPMLPPDDLYHEAVAARGIPGTGEFPLLELLSELGQGVMVDVEVPREMDRSNGKSAAARAAEAVEATRNLMRQAGWCWR